MEAPIAGIRGETTTISGRVLRSCNVFVAVTAVQRNYQPCRHLGRSNAKDIYNQKQRRVYWNQRQCHLAFEWISSRAKAILENRMKTDQDSVYAASRHAADARLSDHALSEIHSILVLELGKVVDFAPHNVLLQRCAIYRQLWSQQNRHLKNHPQLVDAPTFIRGS